MSFIYQSEEDRTQCEGFYENSSPIAPAISGTCQNNSSSACYAEQQPLVTESAFYSPYAYAQCQYASNNNNADENRDQFYLVDSIPYGPPPPDTGDIAK